MPTSLVISLRSRTFDALRRIRGRRRRQRFHLSALLGYRHMPRNLDAQDEHICKMLLGPHGPTIYKALRARGFRPKQASNKTV